MELVGTTPRQNQVAGCLLDYLPVKSVVKDSETPLIVPPPGILHHVFIRGSSTSRKPSPARFRPSTVIAMATPGKMVIHGAFCI